MKLTLLTSATLLAAPTTMGFVATSTSASLSAKTALSMTTTGITDDFDPLQPPQRRSKKSISIPFIDCPPALHNSDLAGNVGFDPLNFSKNKELLWEYREAEIKHARLAMLAGVGWPTSELLSRAIADVFSAPSMLDDAGRVPTMLNGGMARVSPVWWGFCVGMCAAIDLYGVAKARKNAPEYFPGNLQFDPMGLYPKDREGQEKMKLAEIKHGRLAMLGVLGYVVEEFVTKNTVVFDTPMLFQPITETVEDALIEAEQMIEGAELLLGTFYL